jgi:glutamate synthase (NADPH/NADH) small chain
MPAPLAISLMRNGELGNIVDTSVSLTGLEADRGSGMGKPTGFLEVERVDRGYEKPAARKRSWQEFVHPLLQPELRAQASRCMDCGIPFCHEGCPVNNLIPNWNDLIYRDQWRQALTALHSTNNFPEFTGRICPAPCEAACTLNIDDNPVTIKTIECAIVDRGWEEGWITPQIAARQTGKRVAVVGSGPAGMACAQQLARAGHAVTLFEKADRIGGLLRYGIPDFKMEKHPIDRRVAQMAAEGVEFRTSVEVGTSVAVAELLTDYDALALTGGAEHSRDLEVPGRELAGIHFAMDYLPQQNKRNAGDNEAIAAPRGTITAAGKHVIVIGGGDTGSDCIGTANRQGAASIIQLEILPMPPERENKAATWPDWPLKLRTSSSQEEGCERDWAVLTKRATGGNGHIEALECVRVDWTQDAGGRWTMQEAPDSTFELKADLVLLAMGFLGPRRSGMIEQAGVALDPRGNVAATVRDYQTSVPKIFAAGDMRRGQSLVVWAIREGRQCARAIDEFLMGSSLLPR